MEIEITFTAKVRIKGKNMEAVREKFESMELFSEEAIKKYHADFEEVQEVCDWHTCEDAMDKWNAEMYR